MPYDHNTIDVQRLSLHPMNNTRLRGSFDKGSENLSKLPYHGLNVCNFCISLDASAKVSVKRNAEGAVG